MRTVVSYVTTVEALKLNEDLNALRQCRHLLDLIDERNVADDPKQGYRVLRMMIGQLKMCEHFAQNELRKRFLDPGHKDFERNRKTKIERKHSK